MARLVVLHDQLDYVGGGEQVLFRAAEVAGGTHELHLGVLWGGAARAPVARFASIESFAFPDVAPRPWSATKYQRARNRVYARLEELRPDAVLAFSLRAALHASHWFRRNRVPFVWVCQEALPLYESRWGSLKQAVVFSYLARAEPWVVALNDHWARVLTAIGIPPGKLVCLTNAVDVRDFQSGGMNDQQRQSWRAANGIPEGDLVVTCVARLNRYKDQETLLRGVAAAARRGHRIVVACVGGTDDRHYEGQLCSLARDLGIASRVVWAGHREDVRPWLAMADVAVLTSTRECASLALLEAGALGLPVVASRVGGNPCVVRDGITGRLFDARDADGLAAALIDLVAVERRMELGRRLHDEVCMQYDRHTADAAWRAFIERVTCARSNE